MQSRVCPLCTTLQHRDERRCTWCDEARPATGWMQLNALADPWIGVTLPEGVTVEQRVSTANSLYRAQDAGGRNLFARFVRLNRLTTPPDWRSLAGRLGLIRSRRLAHFISAVEHDEYAVFLSEFVEGERLHDRLKRPEAVSVDDALAIAAQVSMALEAIHSLDLVHGRIDSRSIVIATDGRGELRATLCTYGLATGLAPPIIDDGYLPAERARSVLRPSDDIFSVGALLLELLSGVKPHAARVDEELREFASTPFQSVTALNLDIAAFPMLDQLVQSLTVDAEYRVASMARAVDQIGRVREEVKNGTATPVPTRPRTFTGVPNTGVRSAARSNPVGDPNRDALVKYGGSPHVVRADGSSIKVVAVDNTEPWSRDATILDLRDWGIEGRMESLCARGDVVWFGTSRGVVGWFDLASTNLAEIFHDPTHAAVVAVAAADGLIVAGTRSGAVHYFVDGEPPQSLLSGAAVAYVSAAANGCRFAVGRSSGAVDVFQIEGGRARSLKAFEIAQATGVVLSPDGGQLWLSDRDTTTIHDVQTGVNLGTVGRSDEFVDTSDIIAALAEVGDFFD